MDSQHPIAPAVREAMTFPNPVWEEAVRAGRRVAEDVPRELRYYEDKGGILTAPRQAILNHLGNHPATERMVDGEAWDIPSRVTLRPEQVPFVDALEARMRKSWGCVGQAEVGFGKTICSLELAARLGKKTLILVHKEFLMSQWVERILGTKAAAKRLNLPVTTLSSSVMPASLGLDPSQVGIVQQGKWEWEDKAIVIGMMQTISKRALPKGFAESFGLVIVDEVHRAAAPTFAQAVSKFPARWRLGVSATPRRKDGLEDVFYAHIGGIAAVGTVKRAKPRVNRLITPVVSTETQRKRFGRNLTLLVNYLVQHPGRNDMIVRQLVKAVQAGRRVIVFSGRREHLDVLRSLFLTATAEIGLAVSTDFYMGGMKADARKRAEGMQVLFATDAMGQEGLDIPSLDTCFLTTPKGTIVQAVGRILRTLDGKKQPVVVDFVDQDFGITHGLARKRQDEYASAGWT